MDSLLFTTYDHEKISELQDKLHELDIPIKVVGLAEVDYAPQKSYSETSFLNNARTTAHRLAEFTGLPTLSESSGLSVDCLINSLGILPYHHNGQDEKAKLLADLGGIPSEKRTASYYTTFVFTWPNQENNDIVSAGRISGLVAKYPHGNSNYGYDALFVVPELVKTFAEMHHDERNSVSHRNSTLNRLLVDLPDWWRAQESIQALNS